MGTIGSLFTGIMGLELGLEMCGEGPVVWACESDPYARAVIAHHRPGLRIYNDVREIDERAERPDIICGGFPCQPVSVAGKRKAQKDTRWLWPFFAAVIARVRPSVVFIENVPGLRNAGLRDVLADLASLGFDAEWGPVAAAHAGAPHRRRRMFILAHANGEPMRLPAGRPERASWPQAVRASGTCPPWVAADADRVRELEPGRRVGDEWRWTRDGGRWTFEPPVCGVDDGSPARPHRERLLGNACVPAQAALAYRLLSARFDDRLVPLVHQTAR